MKTNIFAVGSPVYVTGYGPCRGFRGIICDVDEQGPLCFYLVALHEGQIKEPLWLIPDDIAEIEGENVSQRYTRQEKLSRVEFEALEIVARASELEQDRSQEIPQLIA
jgi:hypothetical protein